tara:strand:+ start:110 stop:1084 length:975 start_codon:yes stop_codon:yes gene_type:complete
MPTQLTFLETFECACELAYNGAFEELLKHIQKWKVVYCEKNHDIPTHLKKGLTSIDGLPVSKAGDTLTDALLKLCVRMNCTEQCQAVYKVIEEIFDQLWRRYEYDGAEKDERRRAAVFRARMTLLCAGAFDGDVDLLEFMCGSYIANHLDDQKRKLYLRMLDSAAESGNDSAAKSVFEWLCASRRTHFRGISLADNSYDQRLLNVFTRVLSAECTDSADFLMTHSVHLGFNPFLMQWSHVQALVSDLMPVGATKSLDFLCSRSATHPMEFDKEIDKEFIVKTVKEYALSYEKTHFDIIFWVNDRDKINNWLQEKEEPSRKRKST